MGKSKKSVGAAPSTDNKHAAAAGVRPLQKAIVKRRRRASAWTGTTDTGISPSSIKSAALASVPPTSVAALSSSSPSSTVSTKPLSKFQQRLRDKLHGAEFRRLNETLYTNTGSSSFQLLQSDPSLFASYHRGYVKQVERWPSNPLDGIISFLCTQPRTAVVADLGCGEARLSSSVPQATVHSFDLVAANERVVAADIGALPLESGCVDVAVFCLSLMGTDYNRFIAEARRILQGGGTLLIAEVASRFERHDATAFVEGVKKMGFDFLSEHPFVTGRTTAGKNGNGKKQKQKNKKKKKKNFEQQREDEDENERNGSAFFFKFAFRCRKDKEREQNEQLHNMDQDHEGESSRATQKTNHSLPPLGACIYKRR